MSKTAMNASDTAQQSQQQRIGCRVVFYFYQLTSPMIGLSRREALVFRLGGRFVVAAGTSATADCHVSIIINCFHLKPLSILQ